MFPPRVAENMISACPFSVCRTNPCKSPLLEVKYRKTLKMTTLTWFYCTFKAYIHIVFTNYFLKFCITSLWFNNNFISNMQLVFPKKNKKELSLSVTKEWRSKTTFTEILAYFGRQLMQRDLENIFANLQPIQSTQNKNIILEAKNNKIRGPSQDWKVTLYEK